MIWVLTANVALAERPQGLLWNRSGLPATIPLQVKTTDETDYYLELRAPGTDTGLLAAYIRGGDFFRVLVPAGQFDVMFASGPEWMGEDAQFGPDTERFILDPPLTFRVTATRRNGHLIDLTDRAAITIRDFAICQRLALDSTAPLPGLRPEKDDPIARRQLFVDGEVPRYEYAPWRYEVPSRVCD